jgi:hypothetical protein
MSNEKGDDQELRAGEHLEADGSGLLYGNIRTFIWRERERETTRNPIKPQFEVIYGEDRPYGGGTVYLPTLHQLRENSLAYKMGRSPF